MVYVLDVGVAFKWAVPDPLSPKARQLRDDFRNGVHDLIAPDIFGVELAHALTKAERQRRTRDAITAWNGVMRDCPLLHPHAPLIDRAMEISSQLRIGCYDCLYMALAEREGCEMITADQKMLLNVEKNYPFVIPLSAVP